VSKIRCQVIVIVVIAWITFWIGVSVASIMSLISWFVNNYESANSTMLTLDMLSE